jgi:hypothetical protein
MPYGGEKFHEEVRIPSIFQAFGVLLAVTLAFGADLHPPAGERYPLITASGTILPGGRILKPFGREIETGPGPSAMALSPKGLIATANGGFERSGLTIIEPSVRGAWRERNIWARTPNSTAPEIADPDWKGVADGIVFDSEKSLWVSEGESGKVRQIDINSGDHRKIVTLNTPEWPHSTTGNLAYDVNRRLLIVNDRTHSRVAVVDAKAGRVISSVMLGSAPYAIALSPDGITAYVTEADAVCMIDMRDALKPTLTSRIPMASPRALLAMPDRIFVSNAGNDSIDVISLNERRITSEISLGIPSLEHLRGVMPAGLAYDPVTKWLLVAETGINAVGVVDTEKNEAIGHIPTGWKPSQVAISGDRVFVANVLGRGTGPNLRHPLLALGEPLMLHRGSVTTFIMPERSEVLRQTGTVFAANGFIRRGADGTRLPAIRHVVLIVSGSLTFDEVLGDITRSPQLARLGMRGLAQGRPGQFSVKDARITPNHHAVAQDWAFNDNFHVDEAGVAQLIADVWPHLEKHGIEYRKFEGFRANQFIAESAQALPQFIYVHLPETHPSDGYPYEESLVEDNDLEAGRILEYLSHSPSWPETVVYMTGNDTNNGLDHIDSHRTVLLAAGPHVKRRYVSHTNSDFTGLVRTVFELLGVPPMRLSDASAASLRDMLTDEQDLMPFSALLPDPRIFDPAKVNPPDKSPGGNAGPGIEQPH